MYTYANGRSNIVLYLLLLELYCSPIEPNLIITFHTNLSLRSVSTQLCTQEIKSKETRINKVEWGSYLASQSMVKDSVTLES